jgi:LytS/YehU family sensor histidine kinase
MWFFWLFLFITILSHVIIGTLYEFFYTMQKWKEETQQNEMLEKEKLRSELAVLKSQVNPHFLFNTLNTLSALVSENPSKAEDFIDEMSRVYRYLLRNNEEELSSLSEELKFIKSYFHLLKTRHGNGIEMDLGIPDHYLAYRLPPLTLQLLVENAVKHNIIRADSPLRIEIFTEQNLLTVRNKLQRKTINVQSTKVGLGNIATKYRLMNLEGIKVIDDGVIFSVTVPLIGAETK